MLVPLLKHGNMKKNNHTKLYRYSSSGEGIFSAGKRLLPENLIEEAWEARKWMPKPQLPEGEYRFFLTQAGKEKYETTLLKVHQKYLPDIKCQDIDPSKIGSIVYEDEWQVVVKKEIPQIIKDVGFDFSWDEKKVWKLDVPVSEMDINELIWHFEIPFLWEGGGVYNLKSWEVIEDPDAHKEEYERTIKADTSHPIDIMKNKGRWLILDGLHRLMKLYIQGAKKVQVRIIPREKIPDIQIKTLSDIYPIIGMSPGNSYFKDDVVLELLKKVVEKYGKAAILIADIPAISTYIALGYPENRARRDKALPQGNNLRNKVQRAMTELGYSTDQIKIIDWESEIESNPTYQEKYKEVLELYSTNKSFQDAANNATKSVLEYSDKPIAEVEPAVKIAVHYLLSEFAFMEFAPQYLSAKKVTYIYHKNWPVYESYRTGEFDHKARDYLGSETVTVKD